MLYTVSLLLTLMLGRQHHGRSVFSLLGPNDFAALAARRASGATPVFGYGRWWTVLSAGWLHGGVLHILFNMMWVRQLGPAVADIYGAARMVIIYTIRPHRRASS